MLKDDDLVGFITIYRQEVRPFTDKQIELVETFADQAVIAIENMRLLQRGAGAHARIIEALQQQTATSDVLKVISRSTCRSQTVFEPCWRVCRALCEAKLRYHQPSTTARLSPRRATQRAVRLSGISRHVDPIRIQSSRLASS